MAGFSESSSANTDNGFGPGGNDGDWQVDDDDQYGRKQAEERKKYIEGLLAYGGAGSNGQDYIESLIAAGGTGMAGVKEYNEMLASGGSGSGNVSYTPTTYKFNQDAFKIDDKYSGALGAALAGAQNREAPVINQAPQDQFRQGQTALGQQLAARAAGTAPSAAELQMRQGLDSQIAAQRSAAASARGLSPGAAQHMAAQGMAQAQGQTARDTGILRANEQANAEQALGQHLAAARGQDLGLATSQAGMDLQSQAQVDAATANYISMGMSREEAQQAALGDLERLRADNRLGVQGIKANLITGQQSATAASEAAARQERAAYINAGATVLASGVKAYGGS